MSAFTAYLDEVKARCEKATESLKAFDEWSEIVAAQAGRGFSESERMARESYVLDNLCNAYSRGRKDASRAVVPKLEQAARIMFEALESIAAEKCKPDFDTQLPKLGRGSLVSIIDTDTAVAREALAAVEALTKEKL